MSKLEFTSMTVRFFGIATALACASDASVDRHAGEQAIARPPDEQPVRIVVRNRDGVPDPQNSTHRDELKQPTDGAITGLAEIARVNQQDDRIVISLSGNSLFAVGTSALRSDAAEILDRVVVALHHLDGPQSITIEGHKDPIGPARGNDALAFQRAEAVRSYLALRGVTAPMDIRDNDTAEGRANNRRLEIIASRIEP